jgi:hypothetical protein
MFYLLIFTGEKEDNMPIATSFILGVADKKLTEWCYCIHCVGFCFNLTNKLSVDKDVQSYTGCPGRIVKNFGRVFLMLKYT